MRAPASAKLSGPPPLQVRKVNAFSAKASGSRVKCPSRSLFCQLQLSALELDDTRKPSPYAAGPRRFRFSVSAL